MPADDPVEQYLDVSHRIGLRLLTVLTRVCEAAGVEFFIHAGTLLGSVRHSGWIPWDDDVDVVMFRSEYERFRLLCVDGLPKGIVLSDLRSDPSHLSPLGRLLFLDSRRGMFARRRKVASPETVHVPLDIFVLDTTPKTAWATSLWRKAVYMLERIIYARSTTFRQTLSSKQRNIAMTLAATLVSRCLPSSGWRKLHHELCILPGRFSHRSSVALMNDANKQFRRVIMTVEDWRPAREGSFEGLRVPLPARAEDLLRLNYGPHYMELPAPASRRPIHLRNGLTAKIDGREWHCPPSLDTFLSQ